MVRVATDVLDNRRIHLVLGDVVPQGSILHCRGISANMRPGFDQQSP